MLLRTDSKGWITNPGLVFHEPSLSELEEIEVKHFGPVYGEDFAIRNIRRMYEKLRFHGAYIGERLVGVCYSFSRDGLTCIDGLIVDEGYRKQYVATSLMVHVKNCYPGTLFTCMQMKTTRQKKCIEKWDLRRSINSMNIHALISVKSE